MTDRAFPRLLLAAATLTIAMLAEPGPAAAQQDSGWMWGGGSTYGGSGREVVRINTTQHAQGQVIVSFTDRRLYLVTKPGEALSYPIAIPREQSRWQGITSVTMKRENPSWTPTPTMRAENPRLPMLGAGRPSDEPTRRARALSGLLNLPHSRHGRPLDHRLGRLQGLHSHV